MSSSSLIEQEKNMQQQKSDSPGDMLRPVPRNRSVLGEWLRMLAITAVIGALYAWRGGASLLFLLSAAGILMFGGLLLQLCGPRKVQIVRRISPLHPAAGDTLTVEVQLSFSSRIPLPWMIIADYWGGRRHQELLFPGFRRKFTYSYELQEVPRGTHRLQSCSISWGDLPGLFTGGTKPEFKDSFKVLPRPLYVGAAVPGSGLLAGDMMLMGRGRDSGSEAADLREYAPGDPLSRIDWKNSARKGTLQSRVPVREQGRMACIVLANSPENYEIPYGALTPRGLRGTTTPAFEKAVSAAMGLMLATERSGTYVQLFSGGWPEGIARHEGLGKIPARVQDMLTEIAPDGTRSLSGLLEDASRSWIPGMTVTVITGKLEEESARTLARFLVQGVQVEIYYVWDLPAPVNQQHSTEMKEWPGNGTQRNTGTVRGSLERLGARIYCLENSSLSYGYKGAEFHESPGKRTER